jgi:hypothetical protein
VICGENQFSPDQVSSLNSTAIFSLVDYAGKPTAISQPGGTLAKLTELQVAKSIKKGDG